MENNLVSITKTSLLLDINPYTIKRWYKWARWLREKGEISSCVDVGLPLYLVDNRGAWFFQKEDLSVLKKFKMNIKRGQMADFHAKYYWNKKGEVKC